MTASLPCSIRLAMATSPSRVSSGTVPISRRYMRTGSFVLSSAPGVRSRSPSSPPSPPQLLVAVGLLRIDDLDAGAAERAEQVVELLGRGDVGRQQLVHFVVEQVALLLADGDELSNLVVLFFDGQSQSPSLLGRASGQCFELLQQLLLAFPQRLSGPGRRSPTPPATDRSRPAPRPAPARRAPASAHCTHSAGRRRRRFGLRRPVEPARALLRLDARAAAPATRPAARPPDSPPASRSAPSPARQISGVQLRHGAPAPRPAGAPASTAAPARPAAIRTVAGTATAGASVFRCAAALRISSRTTASVIRALCASRSAN